MRGWVNGADIDSGKRPGTTTADAETIVKLEREVKGLQLSQHLTAAPVV